MSDINVQPVALSGQYYWPIRICGDGTKWPADIISALNHGEAFVGSQEPEEDSKSVQHRETGRTFYLWSIKGRSRYVISADRDLIFVKNPMPKSLEPNWGTLKKGNAYAVIPAQGFGDDSRSVACQDSFSYYDYLQSKIDKARDLYQKVLQFYDAKIAVSTDETVKKGYEAEKRKIEQSYRNFAAVSGYTREVYIQELEKKVKDLEWQERVIEGDKEPTPPVQDVCGTGLKPQEIQERKKLIDQVISLLTILSSPPFYPSSVVSEGAYKKAQKFLKELTEAKGCNKKLEKYKIEYLKKQVSDTETYIQDLWTKLIAPPKRGQKYGQLETELKQKAAIIRQAIEDLTRLYKVAISYGVQVSPPEGIAHLQAYLDKPSEDLRQKLIGLPIEKVKSSAEGFVKDFDLQIRERRLGALIHVAEGRRSDLSGENLLKLENAIRFYNKLQGNETDLASNQGDLEAFLKWTKEQADKIRSL